MRTRRRIVRRSLLQGREFQRQIRFTTESATASAIAPSLSGASLRRFHCVFDSGRECLAKQGVEGAAPGRGVGVEARFQLIA